MKARKKIKLIIEKLFALSLVSLPRTKVFSLPCVLLDTSLYSDNTGDQIIGYYCRKRLKEIGISYDMGIPTHKLPSKKELKRLSLKQMKIMLGTNIISPKLERIVLWRLPKNRNYYNNILFFGVGWNGKNSSFSYYSKRFYKRAFSPNFIHSVRDSFTKQKLNEIGVKNVVNTGCPTMWDLTPEFCSRIPTNKHSNVVTTITDYCVDEKNDSLMLNILLDNYENVYVWLQGDLDYGYIKRIMGNRASRLIFIEQKLENYNDLLLKDNDLDYVGTRLHAGIHALNTLHRSIIISIDNRASCIASDTNLPVIDRNEIATKLQDAIQGVFKTDIVINFDGINTWKKQFCKNSTDCEVLNER